LAEVLVEKLPAGKKFYKNAKRLSVCLCAKIRLTYLSHSITIDIGWYTEDPAEIFYALQ